MAGRVAIGAVSTGNSCFTLECRSHWLALCSVQAHRAGAKTVQWEKNPVAGQLRGGGRRGGMKLQSETGQHSPPVPGSDPLLLALVRQSCRVTRCLLVLTMAAEARPFPAPPSALLWFYRSGGSQLPH